MLLSLLGNTLPNLRNPPQHLLVYLDCIQAASCRALASQIKAYSNSGLGPPVHLTGTHSAGTTTSPSHNAVDNASVISLQDSIQRLLAAAMSIAGCDSFTTLACSENTKRCQGATQLALQDRCRAGLVHLLLNIITLVTASHPIQLDTYMPSAKKYDLGPLPPMQHQPRPIKSSVEASVKQQTNESEIPNGHEMAQVHMADADVISHHDHQHQVQAPNSNTHPTAYISRFASKIVKLLADLHFEATSMLLHSARKDRSTAQRIQPVTALSSEPDLTAAVASIALSHGSSLVNQQDHGSNQAASSSLDGSSMSAVFEETAAAHPHTQSGGSSRLPAAADPDGHEADAVLASSFDAASSGYSSDDEDMPTPAITDNAAKSSTSSSSSMGAESNEDETSPGSLLGAALALLCTLACPPAKGSLQMPPDCPELLEAAAEGCRLLLDSAAESEVRQYRLSLISDVAIWSTPLIEGITMQLQQPTM